MRVGFGEKFARASRHVRGAWQTKAEQRQKVSQRNQHFLAKRRSLLLSSVEPSTSARTKARPASHGGPSRGIAPGRARSEREPTVRCRARARQPERPRRQRSCVHLASDPLRVGCLSEPAAPTPPDPAGLTARRAAYPTTAANSPPRRARVHGRRGTCPPRRPEAAGVLRRALAEAKANGEDDPHVAAAPTTSSCTACRGGSTRPSAVRGRGGRAGEALRALAPPRARRCTTWRGCRGDPPAPTRRRRRGCEESRGRTTPTTPPLCSTWRRLRGGRVPSRRHALEESVRVLDASGQGESAVACRRRSARAGAGRPERRPRGGGTRRRVRGEGTRRERAGAFFRSEDSDTEVARIEPGEALKAKKRP